MSKQFTVAQCDRMAHAEQQHTHGTASLSGKLLQSSDRRNSTSEHSNPTREDGADYAEAISEIVLDFWLEDLEATASACQASPCDVFADVFALLLSEAPQLHSGDPGYPGAIKQTMEWMTEDIECVARAFDLDPLDVLEDAMKVVASDTPFTDQILQVMALAESALGNSSSSAVQPASIVPVTADASGSRQQAPPEVATDLNARVEAS